MPVKKSPIAGPLLSGAVVVRPRIDPEAESPNRELRVAHGQEFPPFPRLPGAQTRTVSGRYLYESRRRGGLTMNHETGAHSGQDRQQGPAPGNGSGYFVRVLIVARACDGPH
jgi:hypothetical protein